MFVLKALCYSKTLQCRLILSGKNTEIVKLSHVYHLYSCIYLLILDISLWPAILVSAGRINIETMQRYNLFNVPSIT